MLRAPVPCRTEAFLSSGHQTTGSLLLKPRPDCLLAWKPRKTRGPRFWDPKVNFGPLMSVGLVCTSPQSLHQSVGASSKVLLLASLVFPSETTSHVVGLGVFGLTGPICGPPRAARSRLCTMSHKLPENKGPTTELCFDSGQQ